MATKNRSILAISGSPSVTSRSGLLLAHIEPRLRSEGCVVETLSIRDLPAEDLLLGRMDSPALKPAIDLVANAQALVIATPVYKAAYSGGLKAFLDVLPQFGLAGKSVLPLATGGSIAHLLAIDYALRPVLMSMNPRHVEAGLFVLDKHIHAKPEGGIELDPETQTRLDDVLAAFLASLERRTRRTR